MRRIPRGVAAIAAASTLILTACSTGGDTPGDTEGAEAGGTLRVAYSWYPTCFDYAQSNPFALYGRQSLDTLLSENPETGALEPYLAEEWEVLDGGAAYEFAIREGVTFSNGEALDAEAVAENCETLWALAAQGVATTVGAYLRGYEGAEAVDERTVRVEFSAPNAGFLQANTEGQFGILAPETLAKTPEERCAEGTIGSGPFVLDAQVQDERVEYVKREGYDWAPAAFGRTGEAGVDRIVFQIVPEESVRVAGVLAGDYEIAYSVTDSGLTQAEGDESATPVFAPNRGVLNHLVANTSDPILAESAVRQALLHGIDREELVDTFFGAGVEAATDVVSSTHPYYTDHSDLIAHDPELSRRLLDEAGWTEGADGIREKDGTRLEISLTVSASYDDQYIEYLQSRFQEIGVSFALQQVSDAEFVDLREAGNWQLVISQGAARGDADGIAAFFSSELSTFGASFAPRPDVDALLAEQATTIDEEERRGLVEEAVTLILEEAYAIPIYDSAQVVLVREGVEDLTFPINSWEPILYRVTLA